MNSYSRHLSSEFTTSTKLILGDLSWPLADFKQWGRCWSGKKTDDGSKVKYDK